MKAEGGAVLYCVTDGTATITAATAAQIGLVNRVVDDETLDAEVARIAGRIAGLKAEAVAANKRLVNEQYERAGFLAGTES